ncbi:MAG: hypothetical protein SWY16_25750 [Cyanobacteriota bacterium]|nr:hypothetical protein [Cyanobacteriota bacterium]
MFEIARSMKITIDIEGIELELYRVSDSNSEVGVSVKSLCSVLGKKTSELPPDLKVVESIENLTVPIVLVRDFVAVISDEAQVKPKAMRLLSELSKIALQQFIKKMNSSEPTIEPSNFDAVLEDVLLEDAELLHRLA